MVSNGEIVRERLEFIQNSLKRALRDVEVVHRNTGIFAEYTEDYLSDLVNLAHKTQLLEDRTRRILS